jgi:hypothetical protein
MKQPTKVLVFAAFILAGVFCAMLIAQTTVPSQMVRGSKVTITGEVLTFNSATRVISIQGPLGGILIGVVSTDVSDVSMIKPGSMIEVSYSEAIAAAVRRKGETNPLISAEVVAAVTHPGMPKEAAAINETFTVHSIDLSHNTVVLKDKDNNLRVTEVVRPEFQAKLKDLKPGEIVDITYSNALIEGVRPVGAGEKPAFTMRSGTLVIDRGEVKKRLENTLMIRNEAGRMVKVTVDPKQKFLLDGKEVTVYDLKEGTKLTRTALRVSEASYSE